MRVVIDTKDIAHYMINSGISPSSILNGVFDGFTNAFADAMTDLYNLEGLVTEDIITLEVCPECESADIELYKGKTCNNCKLEF